MAHNPNPSHKKNILPGLQVPSGIDPELEKFLRAVKTLMEQFIGARGQPKERFVTLSDLERAKIANTVVKRGRGEIGTTAENAAAGLTSTAARSSFAPDTTGAVGGSVLRYVAQLGLWQHYPLLDNDGVILEVVIPEEFTESKTFSGGVTVGDLVFADKEDLLAALDTTSTAGGTYTPTATAVDNVESATAFECQYANVGGVVTVSGRVDIDPTSAASTKVALSLPTDNVFIEAEENCAGTAVCPSVAGAAAAIYGDTVNHRAIIEWVASDTDEQSLYFTFTYKGRPLPVPTISSLSVSSADAGDPDTVTTVTGTGFHPATVGRFDGTDCDTSYTSSTEIEVTIPASALEEPGEFDFTVFNPEPGGGESSAETFTVTLAS